MTDHGPLEESGILRITGESLPLADDGQHLQMLASALRALIQMLRLLGLPAVAHYCRLLAGTIDMLAAFYGTPSFLPRAHIERHDSGFPSREDLLFLFEQQENLAQGESVQDTEDALVQRARRRILHGEYPKEEQIELRRRRLFTRIASTELAEPFRVLHPISLKETSSLRFYKMDWRGLCPRDNLFRYCSALFTQNRTQPAPPEVRPGHPVHTLLREGFHLPLSDIAPSLWHIRRDAVPKSLDRYTLGPFHSLATHNPKALSDLFEGPTDFLLKMSLQRMVVEDSRPSTTLLNEILGDPSRQPQPRFKESGALYVLTTPALAERLAGRDERGEPCTVFTLTPSGVSRT